jgi:hypothetical protein
MEEAHKSEIEVPGHRYYLIRPVKKREFGGAGKDKVVDGLSVVETK